MKKIIILLGLVSSFVMFTGCAPCQGPAAPMAPQHHDYKGEVER